MIEWFKNLSEAWQTAIFGAGIAIAIAVIGGLFKLFSLFLRKTEGDIHIGVDIEALKAALKALEMVDTDQSNKLVSELKKLLDEKLNTPTELIQEKYNTKQKLQLEKEFQLYGELWKALVDVRKTAVITPTLDIMPKDKSPYDVYKERYEIAVNAFNEAKNLFEDHRPFYHDDVSKITRDLLSQCRGYIRSVGQMLKSENFDEELHDKADELLKKVPEAIDEIEKVIKGRIGLLQKAEIIE
jgi:tetratricopeptide (TPR) repeat protein